MNESTEVGNEMAIVIEETRKGSELGHILRLWSIRNGLKLVAWRPTVSIK